MENKGFIASLFDLSFSSFVTTKIVKLLYVISILFNALFALGFVISGFGSSLLYGMLALALSPIVFIVVVAVSRIWFELVIIVFKIAENTEKIASK